MKTILLPTDFSETANYALEVAAQLTKKFGSKLILLHMLEISEPLLPQVPLSNDVSPVQNTHQHDLPEALFYMKLARKRFKELADLPFMQGVDHEDEVQNHLDFKGIIDSAHKYNADLIVMGSHGATGIKEVFVGSNTEKVVRTSDIPVLVIKRKHEKFNVRNFVFATNWEAENKRAFLNAYNFLKKFEAKMHLLYVNTAGSEFLTSKEIHEKFKIMLQETNINSDDISTNIYSDKSVEHGILNFSKEIDADLIGIPTHGRRGLAHFLNHSIGEEVANHAEIPVITFKVE
ncbi:MAG: universal stress protein [Aequorivita sp.]